MRPPETKRKSLIVYWLVWLVAFLVALGSIVTIEIYHILPNGIVEYIFITYFGLCMIFLLISNYIDGKSPMDYLYENHLEDWKQLTTVPGLGPGNTNSFRTTKFVHSNEDFGDPSVATLKQDYLSYRRLFWVVFVSFPVLFFVILALR